MRPVNTSVVIFEHDGLSVRAAARTDTGKVRSVNEDSFLVVPGAYVVADGMGGHNAGDVASRLTVEAVEAWLAEREPEISTVSEVVSRANDAVRTHSNEAGRSGMGSTLVAAFVVANADEQAVVVVNVGDSRCYLIQGEEMVQLTKDHSHVQELVESGEISEDEALVHPERNVVTRAIGVEPWVAGDFFVVPTTLSSRLLLCSDGISGELSFDQIREVLADEPDPDAAADALVRTVLLGRAADNATAIVVDVNRTLATLPEGSNSAAEVTGPRVRTIVGSALDVKTELAGSARGSLIATVPVTKSAVLPPSANPAELIDGVPGGAI